MEYTMKWVRGMWRSTTERAASSFQRTARPRPTTSWRTPRRKNVGGALGGVRETVNPPYAAIIRRIVFSHDIQTC